MLENPILTEDDETGRFDDMQGLSPAPISEDPDAYVGRFNGSIGGDVRDGVTASHSDEAQSDEEESPQGYVDLGGPRSMGSESYDSTRTQLSEPLSSHYRLDDDSDDGTRSDLQPPVPLTSYYEAIKKALVPVLRQLSLPWIGSAVTSLGLYELERTVLSGFPLMTQRAWSNRFALFELGPLAFLSHITLSLDEFVRYWQHQLHESQRQGRPLDASVPSATVVSLISQLTRDLSRLINAGMNGVTAANLSFDWLMEIITVLKRIIVHIPQDDEVYISYNAALAVLVVCLSFGILTGLTSDVNAQHRLQRQAARASHAADDIQWSVNGDRSIPSNTRGRWASFCHQVQRVLTHGSVEALIDGINDGSIVHGLTKMLISAVGVKSFEGSPLQVGLLFTSLAIATAMGVFSAVSRCHLDDLLARRARLSVTNVRVIDLESGGSTADSADEEQEDDVQTSAAGSLVIVPTHASSTEIAEINRQIRVVEDVRYARGITQFALSAGLIIGAGFWDLYGLPPLLALPESTVVVVSYILLVLQPASAVLIVSYLLAKLWCACGTSAAQEGSQRLLPPRGVSGYGSLSSTSERVILPVSSSSGTESKSDSDSDVSDKNDAHLTLNQ